MTTLFKRYDDRRFNDGETENCFHCGDDFDPWDHLENEEDIEFDKELTEEQILAIYEKHDGMCGRCENDLHLDHMEQMKVEAAEEEAYQQLCKSNWDEQKIDEAAEKKWLESLSEKEREKMERVGEKLKRWFSKD